MRTRIISVVLILLLTLFQYNVLADEYISAPSNIPLFDNIETPHFNPGDRGTFTLSIENRYDGDMENVNLTAGVYAVASVYEYKDISEIEHPPTIGGAVEHTLYLGVLESGAVHFVNLTIKTRSDTTEGTYFVRFQLTFEYNGTAYIMKSKGYFNDDEWNAATESADQNDPGRMDIEVLDVDGIIPDSSFRVARRIPLWPLYVCLIPTIVMLLVFAFLFYCQEEYNMFPWLDQGFKYWSSKLHQFWRLLKHRFG